MTNTVTVDDKNVATINMTIDSNLAKETYQRTLKAFGASVNIAGFRKGKAPNSVIEKYVGQERIKAEVVERLFPSEFQKVVTENKLNIALNPSIESFKFIVGEDIELKAKVELKPEVKLCKYKDLNIKYDEFKNDADALDKELLQVQKRFSELSDVDRKSTKKDTVVFDFEGFIGDVNGEKIEHGDAKNYTLDLSNSNFIPGFAEGLVGHKAGEEFVIDVTFPKDYSEEKLKGQKAQFKIVLHNVKERKLPELDDELAKKAHQKTLDAMKEDIQKYLETSEKNENERRKSEAVFEKILKDTKIDIQDSMLDREYQAIMQEAKTAAEQQGANFDELVEQEGKDEVEKRFRGEALKRIKNSLIIEKIAQETDLKIEQKDIMEHINRLAMMYGMSTNALFEQLRKNPDSFVAISQQITANKVNEYLLNNNNFEAKKG